MGEYENIQGHELIKTSRNHRQFRVEKHMDKSGYNPVCFTGGLWKHETNNTIFALVVNNFCIKYTSEANVEHFLNSLQQKYSITVGIKAEKYIGITLKWDYI